MRLDLEKILAAGVLLFCGGLAQPVLQAQDFPAADVIQRAVARAGRGEMNTAANFEFTKFTLTEELDGAGNVKERKEKVYNVSYRGGHSSVRLLKVNGHLPTEDDRKKQTQNELDARKLLGGSASGGASQDNFLTPDVAARFQFRLVGLTNLAGRAAYEIAFEPKFPEPPERRLADKLLDHVSGTLWIDAQEFEVARAEVFLRSEVSLLGGVIGSLKKLAYTLERSRVADGVWLSTLTSGDFEGRKLLDSTHIRTKSESVNFHAS